MKFLIEGIDRLGKSELAKGIQNELGYHLYIHYGKPEKLIAYSNDLRQHQIELNKQMFKLLETPGLDIIIDRAHLGETVYAPIARGYDGGYVFDLEKEANLEDVRLILLYADPDFTVEDDGKSLNSFSLRPHEQEEFIRSFNCSSIEDKRMIKVNHGNSFLPFEEILYQALK